MTIFYSTSKEI